MLTCYSRPAVFVTGHQQGAPRGDAQLASPGFIGPLSGDIAEQDTALTTILTSQRWRSPLRTALAILIFSTTFWWMSSFMSGQTTAPRHGPPLAHEPLS